MNVSIFLFYICCVSAPCAVGVVPIVVGAGRAPTYTSIGGPLPAAGSGWRAANTRAADSAAAAQPRQLHHLPLTTHQVRTQL